MWLKYHQQWGFQHTSSSDVQVKIFLVALKSFIYVYPAHDYKLKWLVMIFHCIIVHSHNVNISDLKYSFYLMTEMIEKCESLLYITHINPQSFLMG